MKQEHPMTPGVLVPRVPGGAHPLYPKTSVLIDADVSYSSDSAPIQQSTDAETIQRAADILGSQGMETWDQVAAELRTMLSAVAPTPDVSRLQAEIDRLNQIINSPQSDDFLRAVSTEAEHQRQRWGSDQDQGKTPADWFWLVGYLAGKALHAHVVGNMEKAEHHIITTAAALANWHLSMFGKTDMRPGHADGLQGEN